MYSLLLLLLVLISTSPERGDALTIRVVSWNVNDNKAMGGKLPEPLITRLLGLDAERPQLADVYVVSLQESCYLCNVNNQGSLANLFLQQLQQVSQTPYVVVGTEATRETNTCEILACAPGVNQHGTTVVLVIAKSNVVDLASTFHVSECTAGVLFYKNAEKGIAGVKVRTKDGKNLCFAGAHLDSKSPKLRQSCLVEFLQKGSATEGWKECRSIYITGDFNSRTGEKGEEATKRGRTLDADEITELLIKDEMSGTKPYYGGPAILDAVAKATSHAFIDSGPLHSGFPPTYSILASEHCQDKAKDSLCYRTDRPPSWTDRIICTNCGKVKLYTALVDMNKYSDHIPVVGEYEL